MFVEWTRENNAAYDAGQRAYELGKPNKCPYDPADPDVRFWQMGYESGEMIEAMMLERENRS